jgi:hypothetical protein
MATTLAEVLRHFGPEYLRSHLLSTSQARAWRAIVNCRTAALGGQLLQCDACGARQWRWHSCRNRHCPQCQARTRDAWLSARMGELLDVPYCHLVFTLPHELNVLAAWHPRWVYDTLMRCAAATLSEFAGNPRWLGGTGAFTLVLHTWTQDLRRHLHVHALMACGALRGQPQGIGQWIAPARDPRFLFPVRALSRVFRGKFVHALQRAEQEGSLTRDPATTTEQRGKRMRQLHRHEWVVYAKTPMGGPAAVLEYLSRYTHRTAIGNERLHAISEGHVRLRVRAKDTRGKPCGKRSVSIEGAEFITRLMQHVLPSGFKRVRHYGLLSPALKTAALAAARRGLQMPPPNPIAVEDAQAFMRRVAAIQIERCPHCATGRWQVVCDQPAIPATRPASARGSNCRGPP